MKKKIAFLLAMMMMLALAGCGAKVNDHVVDYKIDLPDGFEETDMEGANACWWNPEDGSNVNLVIVDKAAAADAAFKAVTADILRETVESSLKEVYTATPTITDRFFTKDNVCGLSAYQYSYDLEIDGETATQIIVCVNADKTHTFTYTTSDGATLKAFEESAKNIQLTIE